jgi:hypothetical protein
MTKQQFVKRLENFGLVKDNNVELFWLKVGDYFLYVNLLPKLISTHITRLSWEGPQESLKVFVRTPQGKPEEQITTRNITGIPKEIIAAYYEITELILAIECHEVVELQFK